jgi:tetratricopeptide (TPR) repeat protein
MLDMFDRDFEHALQCLVDSNNVPRSMIGDSSDYYVFRGDIFRYMDRPEPARSCYDSATAILEMEMSERSKSAFRVSLLSSAYAGRGRKEEAIRLAKLAVELCPVTRDALEGVDYIGYLATTYASLGEYDLAIDQLEYLASVAPRFSAARTRINPAYEPLHDHHRFQKLLDKYEGEQGGT